MAATDPARRSSTDDATDAAVGMDHLTVVPANFEPTDGDGDGDEDDN